MARAAKKKTGKKTAKKRGRKSEKSALRKAAEEVAEKLTKAGFEAVFAGGCVRDMLMGKEPKDFDIATSATPQSVQEMFPKTFAVGAQFGVVVVLHGGCQFEVATFRVDSEYSDGRHPDAVEFGDARADVMRRDFTINGMLYDPKKGKVIDYVEGQKDLKKKIVRCCITRAVLNGPLRYGRRGPLPPLPPKESESKPPAAHPPGGRSFRCELSPAGTGRHY